MPAPYARADSNRTPFRARGRVRSADVRARACFRLRPRARRAARRRPPAHVVRQRQLADHRADLQIFGFDDVLRRTGRGKNEARSPHGAPDVRRVLAGARQRVADLLVKLAQPRFVTRHQDETLHLRCDQLHAGGTMEPVAPTTVAVHERESIPSSSAPRNRLATPAPIVSELPVVTGIGERALIVMPRPPTTPVKAQGRRLRSQLGANLDRAKTR